MPINIDTQNETITLGIVDRGGNSVPLPDGASIEFTTSDPTIATVTADPSNPLQGDIVPGGTAGVVKLGSVGTGILEADGVTPVPDPEAQSLEVDPGAPAGERLTLAPNQ